MVGVEGPGAPAPLGIELSDPAPATAITPTLPSDHVLWSLVGEFLHADVLRVDRTLATMVDAPGIISEVAWKAMVDAATKKLKEPGFGKDLNAEFLFGHAE